MVKSYIPSTERTMYDMVHHCIIDGTITRRKREFYFLRLYKTKKGKLFFKCYQVIVGEKIRSSKVVTLNPEIVIRMVTLIVPID